MPKFLYNNGHSEDPLGIEAPYLGFFTRISETNFIFTKFSVDKCEIWEQKEDVFRYVVKPFNVETDIIDGFSLQPKFTLYDVLLCEDFEELLELYLE